MWGLNFLLRCNYHTKYFQGLQNFYTDILTFFDELKSLYRYDFGKVTFLFNNKEILVNGKPVFFKEWFSKGVVSVKDLWNESGQYLSFQEYISKCKTNFLQCYQVLSSIPNFFIVYFDVFFSEILVL